MTTAQIAAKWGTSQRTTRQILKRYEVEVLRLDRTWRVRRSDVEALTSAQAGIVQE